MIKILKACYSLTLVALFISLLSSCANTNQGYGVQANRYPLTTDEYMQLAATNQATQKQAYLLKAAGRSLQDKQAYQAQQIINQVTPADAAQQIQQQLLQAQIFNQMNRFSSAQDILSKLADTNNLNPAQQVELHQMLANAYQGQGNIIQSINQRTQLTPLLNDNDRQQNLITIWQSLQKISPQKLQTLAQETPDQSLQSWLQLALITKQANTPSALLTALNQWRAQYPNSPANALVPADLSRKIATPTLPQHIALLVPLSGKFANAGNAIKNGFYTAYYHQKKSANYAPTVKVYNTANQDITKVYQQAINDGANFVVGPLQKNNVATLAANRLPVPTVVLNTLPNEDSPKVNNLYTFGLSPIDEAEQAAKQAWNNHLTRAAIITPDNAWGKAVATAFKAEWQNLGGNIVVQMDYANQQQLANQTKQLMNIDQANERYQSIRHILNEKIRYVPRRRKDIDVVFVAAQPVFARQIRPLLRFFYAGNIPVYAISQVYAGSPNKVRDRDLNGIFFCDIPWVLENQQLQPSYLLSLKQNAESIWPNSFRHNSKLYALGVDAFDIIPKLNQMELLPQFGVPAATGTLYLTQQNHIYRKLPWAQFVKGTPRLIQ